MNNRFMGIIYVMLATLGFSFIPILIKLGINSGLSGLYFVGTSFLLATLVFWSIIFIKKQKLEFSYLYLSICTAANIAIFFFQLKAYATVSVSLFNILYFTYPVFVLILGSLFFSQKFNKRSLLSLLFSICGLILAIGIFEETSVKFNIVGVIFSLLAALSNAVFFLSIQQALKKTNNIATLAYIFTLTSIFYTTMCLNSGVWTNTPNTIQIVYILLMAIASTVLPQIFMTKGINAIGASTASIINLFQPVITLIAARFLFGDSMTLLQMTGGLFVLIGVIILVTGKNNSSSVENE